MTAFLPISRGYFVLVDDEDYDWLSRWKWTYVPASDGRSGYAARWEWIDGRKRTIYVHRQILGAPHGSYVDHQNGDKLDNRRCNIRVCSPSQNHQNERPRRVGQFKGVFLLHRAGRRARWQAQIKLNGRSRVLGYFNSPEAAARAYDQAAAELFGDFARLNFGDAA